MSYIFQKKNIHAFKNITARLFHALQHDTMIAYSVTMCLVCGEIKYFNSIQSS